VIAADEWWSELAPEEGQGASWRIGPLTLRVIRLKAEWRVAWRVQDEEAEPTMEVDVPVEELDDRWTIRRYGFSTTTPSCRLAPALSDRTIVSRPAIPFVVPPGQSINLLVSTPLWLRVEVEGAAIQELPTLRLSDTWFGASTREGQLCYAARTHLRTVHDPVELPGWRALTPVRVSNRAADPLVVERLALPVPRLSIYRDGDSFWTSAVTLERPPEGEEEARVIVEPGAPTPGAARLGEPRSVSDENPVARVFNSIFR